MHHQDSSTTSLPTPIYNVWQRMFTTQKLAPLLRRREFCEAKSILELGCAGGINRPNFKAARYVGVDIDSAAINFASKRTQGDFICADFTTSDVTNESFEAVLIHSVLHHIPNYSLNGLADSFRRWVSNEGYVHIVDAIRPEGIGIPYLLAQADRGKFIRPRAEWIPLLEELVEIQHFEEFSLSIFGLNAYNMFYVIGRPKSV